MRGAIGRACRRRLGNVGSFFKNPIVPLATWQRLRSADAALVGHPSDGAMKLSAAQLIDLAGGKRLRVGDAAVWPRQPLVLVNRGAATGSDFLSLAGEIRAAVRARFDVLLEIEPRVYADY